MTNDATILFQGEPLASPWCPAGESTAAARGWPILSRREFGGQVAAAVLLAGCATTREVSMNDAKLYGLIGQMKAAPGKRSELAGYLREGTQHMPGNRLYLIGEDLADLDSLWITEVWDTAEAHLASLQLPGVKQAIAKGRPIIAGFGTRVEIKPVGGWLK